MKNDLRVLIKHCLYDMKFLNTGTEPANEEYYMKDLDITEEQKDRFYCIMNDLRALMQEVENGNKKDNTNINIMEQNISFLGLSTRVNNALFRARINTIEELCNKTYEDIMKIRCFGEGSVKELIRVMQTYNLYLKEDNE